MSQLKQNAHGGNIYKASKNLGIGIQDILDFSANINPLGLPPGLKEAIFSSIEALANYPDPDYSSLKAGIAGYLNIPEDTIIVGNGASEVIFLLMEALKPKKVLIPAPTFSEYSRAAERCGADIEYFELREEENFVLDINELKHKIDEGVEAVFICNPNNPTSTVLKKNKIFEILEYTYEREMLIIVDEAFIELTVDSSNNSMVEYLSKYKNLFIIRAFTKLFAIPGLRLGYGLGHYDVINKMWNLKTPWSVNSLACCVGEILHGIEPYLQETTRWLAEEKSWLYSELRAIPKLKVFEPQTNFILIKLEENDLNVTKLRELMETRGILIRDASNFKYLNDKFFRVAIKDRGSNIKFLKELSEIMK
ncbi:MAG: threonine-phosphate decarboxylase CobD [Clostridia bacterium]|nr:threonine-phosphate decarboxylase CobD [Clostridia bacterium]